MSSTAVYECPMSTEEGDLKIHAFLTDNNILTRWALTKPQFMSVSDVSSPSVSFWAFNEFPELNYLKATLINDVTLCISF